MDVIKEARNLGKAIQSDPRFLRYAKARLANDDNSELQDAIGSFNLVRMELDREANSETKSDDKIKELNEKLERERKGQDPLELMEKSYEMAARYFPGQTGGQVKNIQPAGVTGGSSGNPAAIAAGRATEHVVSSLAVPPVPDTIPRNYGFATAVGGGQLTGANTIRACVAEDQTVTTGA